MKSVCFLALLSLFAAPVLAAEPSDLAKAAPVATAAPVAQDAKNLSLQLAAVMPLDQQVNEFTQNIAQNLPDDKRELFRGIMKKNIDIVQLRAAAAEALLKTYTVPEMKLLLDFYSKPETRIIMGKMSEFAAVLAPSVEAMVKKGVEESKKAGVFPGVQ